MIFGGMGGFCGTYILKEGKIAECHDIKEWAEFIENPKNKRVDYTEVGDCYVSTVFLGIDHGFGSGEPLLFESMVFLNRTEIVKAPWGGSYKHNPAFEEYTTRYATLEEAKRGHRRLVNKMKNTVKLVRESK